MLYNSDLDLYRKQQLAIARVREAQQKAEDQLRQSLEAQQLFEPQNAPDLTPERQTPPSPAGGFSNFGTQPPQGNPPQNRQWQGANPRMQGQHSNRTGNAAGQTTPSKPRGLQDLLGGLLGQNGQGGQGGAVDTLKSTLSSVTKPIEGILDTFDIDGEKLIILLAMWVIFNENADKTLLMALGYLLL